MNKGNLARGTVLTAAAALAAAGSASAVELKPGDKAPAFKLVGSDGNTYKLSDFHGKRAVVLAWFPKAFTPGCTAECTSFRADGQGLRAFDVAYFTASCDTVEKNKKFAESLNADYPILSDPEGKVAEAYGVVDADRRVPRRWTFYIGQDGKILAIDKQVETAEYAKDVAKKLEALGVPKKPSG